MQSAQVAFADHLGDYLPWIYECRERQSEHDLPFQILLPKAVQMHPTLAF